MSKLISPTTALDQFVKWEPLCSGRASFFSGVDNDTGTIRMAGGGIWCPEDARRYFEHQRPIIEMARRRFGTLKVFMDIRDWVVENAESVLQFQDFNAELFRPDDRLAAVVRSSIDKQNSRDAIAIGDREAFVSPNAAETWLHAYSQGSSGLRSVLVD
jgi:hypothetical protein